MVMRLLGLVLIIAGGVFVWLGVQEGLATWQRMDKVEEVTGQIVRYDPAPAGGEGVVPVVTFTGPDGNTVEAKLAPVDRPEAAAGVPVRLIYPPGRPDLAQSGDLVAIWSPAAIPAGGGALVVLLGLAWLTAPRKRPEDLPLLPWYIRYGLFAAGLALCVLAWNEYEAVVDTLESFPRSRGEVVALEGNAPVVRFVTADGVAVDYVDRSVEPGSFSPGERVTIGYSKANPSGARIEQFWEIWSGPATLGAIGGFVLLAALYAASIRRGKPKPPPPERIEPAALPPLQ